jgi:hypothetical protein
VIDGTLHVDIQAVVEPDGNLVQTGQLESPDGHDIPLDGVPRGSTPAAMRSSTTW